MRPIFNGGAIHLKTNHHLVSLTDVLINVFESLNKEVILSDLEQKVDSVNNNIFPGHRL